MARLVWKHLPSQELETFRAYLEGLPAAGKPRYGMLGVKASWWSRLGGPARPFVLVLAGGRLALSKRSFRGHRELTRTEYPLSDLKELRVRRGPLLESARLIFADRSSVRLGGLPRRQSRPLQSFLKGQADALEPLRLSPAQLTNFCQALQAVGLSPCLSGNDPRPA